MATTALYQRIRPYTEQELYPALVAYLDQKYLFRRLEIDQWLGDQQVIYINKDDRYYEELDEQKSAEELWDEGKLEWQTCTVAVIKNICSEFIFRNGDSVGKGRKKLIRDMATAVIEQSELTQTVKFNPVLKSLIDKGRKRVSGVKPLAYGSDKRTPVELNVGDTCYIARRDKSPYMANPAYVFKKSLGSYLLIYFYHTDKKGESSEITINSGRFLSVQANEVGLTPEQAVLQRFC